MDHGSVEHLPLVESNIEDLEDAPYGRSRPRTHYKYITAKEKLLLVIIVLQTIALVTALFIPKNQEAVRFQCRSNEPLIYSPADSVIEYEVKSFTPGREQKTIYQGLSDEADHAWGELYNHTFMKIPRNEAVLLPNKTYPIKDDPGYYLGGLDVFHQLHCLNNVRRALHRDHYGNDTDLDEEHVSHCIDTIRQSLMCSADTSVNVWQWSTELSAVVGYSTQAHSCRNFEKLRDWARSRRLHKWIDIRFFVENDLPDPPIIS
ncbi:hypothetical protein CPB84DRAFT_1737235 [Gymnopilus junonius]|uniref:Uncharacterized protein n=1 Tax=Gymnopilus junonius TaxID=109634 RepID=A0A9P5N9D0_GYMJU|nr:hypothetical protein CPB84DRAFT_1737235 [Gymnopilus junonius]